MRARIWSPLVNGLPANGGIAVRTWLHLIQVWLIAVVLNLYVLALVAITCTPLPCKFWTSLIRLICLSLVVHRTYSCVNLRFG